MLATSCMREFLFEKVKVSFPYDLHNHAAVLCSPDKDQKILFANKKFEYHTGYSLDEVMGENLRLLQGPETAPQAITLFRYLIERKIKGTVEILNYTKSGEKFWNRVSMAPIYNSMGELTHFISVQQKTAYGEKG